MRKLTTFTALALLMASPVSAIADGLSLKDAPAPAAPAWDIAFGGGIASNYMFRGISQSANLPSGSAYTEFRYNINPTLQGYAGVAIESIDFPNRAASETDFYFGIRPTFDKLSLDIGGWYYWYPGGDLYNGAPTGPAYSTAFGAGSPNCTNGFYGAHGACNAFLDDVSFWEVYGKATYAVTDAFTLGGNVFYDPSWLNSGADGTYASVTVKYTLPSTWTGWLPSKDLGAFISGEYGHYWFGRTNAFYGYTDLPEYNTWNVGLSFTYKVFTLDLRYVDTDLSRGNCNVLTGDQGASYSAGNISSINPSGLGSNWCGSTFVAKLSFDLTAQTNLK